MSELGDAKSKSGKSKNLHLIMLLLIRFLPLKKKAQLIYALNPIWLF